MDKNQARQSISKLFTQPFNWERYQLFLRNLLNRYEPRDGHYTGNHIPDAFKQHIKQYWRIGKYVDPEGRELDLLIVEVKSLNKLERARSSLRNFSVNRLKQFEKEASLIAFYAEDDKGADWRFSFVKIEHEAYKDDKGKIKLKQELTPAKRYSYLVGVHENSHTASKQLLPLLEMDYADPRIEEIEAAFGIEKVTDEFFDQYKVLFQKLAEHLKRQAWFKKGSEEERDQQVSRFAKKLLGQIVFLYFLQKKGWLGVAEDKAWGTGSKRFMRERHNQVIEKGGNYYRDFLQYLFYEALADERKGQGDPGYYARFNCRIPFLNGGLFEADYDWRNEAIELPNSLFHNDEKTKAGDEGTGILDVFDRYNFTIKEDEPLEKEVAVDPEMLGKVFENMLEVGERKRKGAFYTPREIVHYMCQESLIHYLDNRLNIYAAAPELAEPQGDIFGNVDGQQSHGGTNIKAPKADLQILIRKGHLALENDTRVLGAGKETRDYKFQLPEPIRLHAKEIDAALNDIKACDPAIGSGAFPVGLLHEIVNARLALAPHSGNAHGIYELKRHAIGESIYGVDIDASAIDIARLRLWLSLIVDEEDYGKIEALPNLDYKIVRGDSLLGIDDAGNVDDIFNPKFALIGELEKEKQNFFSTTDHEAKVGLSKKITGLIHQITDGKEAFDFKIYFSEVWHQKGGFDVVLGNPPYRIVYDRHAKSAYEKIFSCFKRNNDLYVAFFQKGLTLLCNKGGLIYITPNTYLNGDYFVGLRRFITKYYSIIEIIDFKSHHIFDDPTVFVAITHLSNSTDSGASFVYKLPDGLTPQSKPVSVKYTKNSDAPLTPVDPIYGALQQTCKVLFDDVFLIKDVGFNYWTTGAEKNRKGDSIGKRVFLKGKKSSANDIPYLKGRNISKFSIDEPDNFLRHDYETYLDSGKDTFRFSDEILKMSPKICYRQTADRIIAAIDYGSMYCDKTVHVIVNKPGKTFDLRYVLALLNSELFHYLYKAISQEESGRAFSQVKTTYLKKFPFIAQRNKLICLVVSYLEFVVPINQRLVSAYFEQLIDSLVYELYYPNEIKAANKEILPHLGDLTPVTDTMSEEEKFAVIQREFDRLYDPRHPVRSHLETLDSVEVVRTIREALKKKGSSG